MIGNQLTYLEAPFTDTFLLPYTVSYLPHIFGTFCISRSILVHPLYPNGDVLATTREKQHKSILLLGEQPLGFLLKRRSRLFYRKHMGNNRKQAQKLYQKDQDLELETEPRFIKLRSQSISISICTD